MVGWPQLACTVVAHVWLTTQRDRITLNMLVVKLPLSSLFLIWFSIPHSCSCSLCSPTMVKTYIEKRKKNQFISFDCHLQSLCRPSSSRNLASSIFPQIPWTLQICRRKLVQHHLLASHQAPVQAGTAESATESRSAPAESKAYTNESKDGFRSKPVESIFLLQVNPILCHHH